jgi:hypothetical protein
MAKRRGMRLWTAIVACLGPSELVWIIAMSGFRRAALSNEDINVTESSLFEAVGTTFWPRSWLLPVEVRDICRVRSS